MSDLDFSHPCFVSVLFTGPSLLEMKIYRIFFPLVDMEDAQTSHFEGKMDYCNFGEKSIFTSRNFYFTQFTSRNLLESYGSSGVL